MDIKKLWNEKDWKNSPELGAAASALVYGMLVHLFALTNLLHNHDNIASQPGGFGLGVDMGRWFLEILGRFFDKAGLNYNLPSVNGMIYIALLAVAAALLVSVLKMCSVLSITSVTWAKPTGERFWVPPKITSSILAPRRVLELCSPMTQRMASEILDFPEPLGPTMAVMSSPKRIRVLSGKDLKPCNSNDFRYTV